MYRHYGCCETARAASSLPKIETRRACDRCKRFKARCSGGIPCDRCRQASHECTLGSNSHQASYTGVPQGNRSPTTSSTISAEQLTERNTSGSSPFVGAGQGIDSQQAFNHFEPQSAVHSTPAETFSTSPGQNAPALDSLDWNFFYSTLQDITEPEAINGDATNRVDPDFTFDPWVAGFPGMVEGFSPQSIIDDAKLDWNFDGFSLSKLDPFEAHRLKVVEYLRNSCNTTSSQLSFFSPANSKVFFHAFFRRFQPHSPFLHLSTFDVNKISTSLFLAMVLVGALHCGEVGMSTDDVTRALWHPAESYVWSQATVLPY